MVKLHINASHFKTSWQPHLALVVESWNYGRTRNRTSTCSSIQPPPPPTDPAVPQAPQQPGQQVVHLKWSYFKPEFSGKPEKDAKAHLLHTNYWMNAYHFIEGVQRFCLTLPDCGIIL